MLPFQGADSLSPEDITFTVVSQQQPTPQQLEDLKFAWRCVKHVKSNAITVAKDGKLLGMGSGQPNRCELQLSCYTTMCMCMYAWQYVQWSGTSCSWFPVLRTWGFSPTSTIHTCHTFVLYVPAGSRVLR